MRGFLRRAVRLDFVAVAALALAVPVPGALAQAPTQTTLKAETRDQGGHTRATARIAVTGQDGEPATGAVVLRDGSRQIAGAALDTAGQTTIAIDLAPGSHQLSAAYLGDSVHQASISPASGVQALTTGVPDFTISVKPAALTLIAGQSGSATVSITPVNSSALTSPMFLTLSCSNLPDQSACTYTPQTVEIQPNATADVTSDMVLTTQAESGKVSMSGRPAAGATALAVLFPGMLALGGIAWGTRRRRVLSRLALLALVGMVTVLGATGCSPQYGYYHHGPDKNKPTPAGTYTLKLTAQTSNGVSATMHSTSFVLTVK